MLLDLVKAVRSQTPQHWAKFDCGSWVDILRRVEAKSGSGQDGVVAAGAGGLAANLRLAVSYVEGRRQVLAIELRRAA